MVKSIYLQDGEEIFVDDEDYERMSQYTWTKSFKGNNRRITKDGGQTLNSFLMEGSYQIKKNNDFTKSNLTTKGNKTKWNEANYDSTSKYKGVSWNKKTKKWRVDIASEGKRIYLGQYCDEDEAAKIYNQAVLDYWGGEGYLNVIGEDNRKRKRTYKTYKHQYVSRGNKTGYRGVSKSDNKVYCKIRYYKKGCQYIGLFNTTHQAALAYNKCAIYLHGDDAILNDVPITDELKEFIDNWKIPEKIKQLKED